MSRTAFAALSRRSGSSMPFTLASSLPLASHSAVGNAHNRREAVACWPHCFNMCSCWLVAIRSKTDPAYETADRGAAEAQTSVTLDWQRHWTLARQVHLLAATLRGQHCAPQNRPMHCLLRLRCHVTTLHSHYLKSVVCTSDAWLRLCGSAAFAPHAVVASSDLHRRLTASRTPKQRPSASASGRSRQISHSMLF